ncbi:MAG: hypothetical protein IJ443_00800 [Firmicutes bacterium]|nr:hypothetical protein [Bacillota bacterium]
MLKNDRVNLVIALLIAIGLWVYVVGMENPEKDVQIRDVPISFINEDTLTENGLTLLSVSDTTVDVQVKGELNTIKNIDREDIKVMADLEGYKEGEHTIRLQIGKINNVEIESKQKITIAIDQLVTEEKPVSVSMEGLVSDDSEPYIVQVSPQEIRVTGAKTLVDSIVKLDAPLDIEKVGTELKSFTVTLRPINKSGQQVESVVLSETSTSVSAVNLSKKTVRLNVPVIGQDSDEVERTITLPKTITIKGMDTELKKIDSITAEPVHISDVYEDTTAKIVPILPEGIEVAANSQELYVQISVKGMGKRNFEYGKDAVIVEGVEEKMTVTVEDVNIDLSVTGKENVVEHLTGQEFSFVVNVRNLKPGTHKVVLNCRYETELSMVKFTPETITVVIESHAVDSDGEPGDGENSGGTAEPGAEVDGESEGGMEAEPGTNVQGTPAA